MRIWHNINRIVDAATNTVVKLAETAEKSVDLISNEVDNLEAEQHLRLDRAKAEREEFLKASLKQLRATKAKAK